LHRSTQVFAKSHLSICTSPTNLLKLPHQKKKKKQPESLTQPSHKLKSENPPEKTKNLERKGSQSQGERASQ
jgi:hypothetical protein